MLLNTMGNPSIPPDIILIDRCGAPTVLISPAGKIQHQPPHVIRLADPLAHHLPTPGGSHASTIIETRTGATGPVTTGPVRPKRAQNQYLSRHSTTL